MENLPDPTHLTALVVVGNQPVEQSHAEPRSPAPIDLAVDRRHGGAGDVEMRPGSPLLDEALEELRGGDRPAPLPSRVLHVGDLRVDHLVVFRPERQPPQFLSRDAARPGYLVRELIVVAEEPSMLL